MTRARTTRRAVRTASRSRSAWMTWTDWISSERKRRVYRRSRTVMRRRQNRISTRTAPASTTVAARLAPAAARRFRGERSRRYASTAPRMRRAYQRARSSRWNPSTSASASNAEERDAVDDDGGGGGAGSIRSESRRRRRCEQREKEQDGDRHEVFSRP